MPLDKELQYPATEDDCVYFYDETRKKWKKICDVQTRDLPISVKSKIKEDQKKADKILHLPLK